MTCITACSGSGPSDLDVTRHVKSDFGYTVNGVTNIRCRREKGNADLYSCKFNIVGEHGRKDNYAACFRYNGSRWEGSGVGRNCYAFR